MIAHNRPLISQQEADRVTGVLLSGFIGQGERVEALEAAFRQLYGGGEACACSSGTAGLYLALKGLGIRQGDPVAVPAYACSALLNAVYMAGGKPVVVDVREDDFTIHAGSLQKQAPEARAVIAVHTFGARADVSSLKDGVPLVIQDCCQSLGGVLENGAPVGVEGDAAVFSFYATKIITCGHGGLVWDPVGRAASWGRDFCHFDYRKTYRPRFNFLLTDFQAEMALCQLSRLEHIRSRRQEVALRYLEALSPELSFQKGLQDPGRMVYRFVLVFPESRSRDEAARYLLEKGIKGIVPLEYWELLHRYLKLDPVQYPNAEKIAATTLSIPLYPALSDEEVGYICKVLKEVRTS